MSRDLRSITIIYDFDNDETFIESTTEFNNLPKIHQLDALQDAIHDMEELYNKKLKEFNSGIVEGDSFYRSVRKEAEERGIIPELSRLPQSQKNKIYIPRDLRI